ncbi:NAD-dependent epimerase/dehydratase family protein [Litoribrevibacter albus]|uniref:NDP-sugar dehydratase or epimerase n=1 Tax=Litoribrevibacter albus TaxID=1473156 RepID=A0AA37SEY9_9GAMM|nr:NAD-dependent epimerase/dehydratase family protein [Litoribrevibacter albus]GLQ33212.1 NDP-sugar dehydratase or epimerase [Litoribrevibacter albus]
MKWLITGGCGFIGLSLVKNLLADTNNKIIILDNLTVGTKHDLAQICKFEEIDPQNIKYSDSLVQFVQGDILDADLVKKLSKDVEIIVHLAANTGVAPSVDNPRMDCENNVIGTFNVLEAARTQNVLRVVFASSGAPIGEVSPPIHEELAPHPVSPYGASKLAGEGYCSAYYRTFGVDTVVLRFGNVYGPGSAHKSSVVAKFIKRAMDAKPLEIYGDGSQTRDFIYIDDLIKAINKAARVSGVGGEIFQIATNKETTVSEISMLIIDSLKENNILPVGIELSPFRLGDVQRNFSDTSKAKKLLGWRAETSLKTGINLTVRDFINEKI